MARICFFTSHLVASIMAIIGNLLNEAHDLLLALNRSGHRIHGEAKGQAGQLPSMSHLEITPGECGTFELSLCKLDCLHRHTLRLAVIEARTTHESNGTNAAKEANLSEPPDLPTLRTSDSPSGL